MCLAFTVGLPGARAEPPSRPAASAQPAVNDGETPAADPDAVLGELVVAASEKLSGPLILPKIGVVPVDDSQPATRIRDIVARDLDLSGEFKLVSLPNEGAGADVASDRHGSDLASWREANARFLVRVDGAVRPDRRLDFAVELVDVASETVVFESRRTAAATEIRVSGHEFADRLIEAVTGDVGPFNSELTFVGDDGKLRRVHLMDPDGERLRAVSPAEHVALSPAFGPNEQLFYLASANRRPFRIYSEGETKSVSLDIRGSLYGLDFSDDRKHAAVAVATGDGIRVFAGEASLSGWEERTRMMLALHPSFGPRGKLAYAGTRKRLQRIYVGRRAVSLPGLSASSPSFCRHPGGTRLVYSVGVRKNADIVASEVNGTSPVRLTRWRGRNSSPACSPDGRLIAFFSTRKQDGGPGLYLMRLDGRRPKKIADVLGHSLQWSNRRPSTSDDAAGDQANAR